MTLNKFMHPRNRYKNCKPSFLELALKYPEFRAHTTQDDSGKVFLDFKNAEALKALTTCLLKEDFNLSVDLPENRLVPTLPLRLNYIHWLEDILGTDAGKWGIDIGTGASCIYPLLAATMNKWKFLATEADPENVFYATNNVKNNGLQDEIHVHQVSRDDVLIVPTNAFNQTTKFDFCMCNPPFFADHMEAQAMTKTRSVDRPEAGSVSTASPQECIAQGGEVGFIRQMIEESTVLREKIRLYTSMVGKKSSLTQLKEELRQQKIVNFTSTEFCQGKTMRWGIAWTYDQTIIFPRSMFESRKEKPPLQFVVPRGAGGVEYQVHEIAAHIRGLLESIKVHCYQGKKAKSYSSLTLTAVENTWCHQRRLRRQQRNIEEPVIYPSQDTGHSSAHVLDPSDTGHSININGKQTVGLKESVKYQDIKLNGKRTLNEPDRIPPNSKKIKVKSTGSDKIEQEEKPGIEQINEEKPPILQAELQPQPTQKNTTVEAGEILSDTSPKDYILKCVLRLKRSEEQVLLELEWLDGSSRELMHQVMTFLKNKLVQR
ncbi:unnamed protein product [Lymnaea stagnalis]|uniref:U6 small nuclear RNA (adenine-(43)-N(6))-methyltransferase n=1 Tax=Lymnaea stagnalis TaxID=6523 RepID=A0AAV2IL05_LYMST